MNLKDISTFLRKVSLKLIPKKPKIYNFFRAYVDFYNGDNNDNMLINGEIRFLKKNLRDNNILLDVGAKKGEWTKYALEFKKNIYIHCFEPSKISFKLLEENNFPENVICNNLGLSSKKEERELYSMSKESGGNTLYLRSRFKGINGIKSDLYKEIIKLDTLDNYCTQKKISSINYLKIDVEGHEYEVLKGGKKMIENNHIDIIQFEYGGCYIDANVFLRDIFNLFEGLNYNFYKIYPNYVKPVKSYNPRYENFQYQNWLIIRKDFIFES
ncbi:MAG: FkbM family methyltransferase [Candidatus Thorarchaeota archaeon]